MSRPSDIINEAVDRAREAGPIIVHAVAVEVLDALDDEGVRQMAIEGLSRRIKTAAERGKAEVMAAANAAQPELPFNLARSYALDIGERVVKLTRDLTELEVCRIIAIREESIEADRRSLAEIKRAYSMAAPVWSSQPQWTFGQVLDAIVAAEAA